MSIASIDPDDQRTVSMLVAGPAALLVAKIHKIFERSNDPGRTRDKDALDVLRLLQAVDTEKLSGRLHFLRTTEVSRSVATEAIELIPQLFLGNDTIGTAMAVRAAGVGADPDVLAASMTILFEDLLATQ